MSSIEIKEIKVEYPEDQINETIVISFEENPGNFLGSGAYGKVHRVSGKSGVDYALKIMRMQVIDNVNMQKLKKSYLREIIASKKINYENVGKTICFGRIFWDGRETYCLLSEFINGKDIQSAISDNYFFDQNIKLNILLQMAKGIAAIHSKGIVHRDISSRNIMINHDNVVKIIDFGIAFFLEATLSTLSLTIDLRDRETDPERTKKRGNPSYMAPELWDPIRYEGCCGLTFDPLSRLHKPIYASDIFSFGVIAYEIYAEGRYPFTTIHSDYNVIKNSICNDSIVWPSSVSQKIPDTVKEIIKSCLEKSPMDRPNINQLIQKIENLISNLSTEVTNSDNPPDDGNVIEPIDTIDSLDKDTEEKINIEKINMLLENFLKNHQNANKVLEILTTSMQEFSINISKNTNDLIELQSKPFSYIKFVKIAEEIANEMLFLTRKLKQEAPNLNDYLHWGLMSLENAFSIAIENGLDYETGQENLNFVKNFKQGIENSTNGLISLSQITSDIVNLTPEIEQAKKESIKSFDHLSSIPVSYTHLTLPTNREV